MNARGINDALVNLDDAIDALTLDAWQSPASGRERDWVRVPSIEATIGEELMRIDSAIGGHGKSMFAILAHEVRRAVIAIEAARQALRPGGDPPCI